MIPRPTGRTVYNPPSCHSGSFGRRTTKPPWFSIRNVDRSRRPIEDWGNPRNIPRVEDQGAPFRHDLADTRLDRPTVTFRGVERDASPRSRMNVPRDEEEKGRAEKAEAIRQTYKRSRLQLLQNIQDSHVSDVKELITGQAGCSSSKILLYPYKVDHRIALAMEHKGGPRPWYDERHPPPRPNPSKELWDQTMYVKYSRIRSDFPYLKPSARPAQEP